MSTEIVAVPDLDPADRAVIAEIAEHLVSPSPVQRLLDLAGKPVDAVVARLARAGGRLLPRISEVIDAGVRRAVRVSLAGGERLARDGAVLKRLQAAGHEVGRIDEVRGLPLGVRDAAADALARGNAALVTGEGAVMGTVASLAEALPGAQLVVPALISADVAASLTLLSRHLVQMASCYGYSVRADRANAAHVLAAMAPQQYTHDEGFLPMKVYVMNAARETGEFLAALGRTSSRMGFDRALQHMAGEAPQLVRLVGGVMDRLGVRVSQKVFGMLLPLVGGALNGSLNLAFQVTGHRTGQDYFRMLALSERYGEEAVRAAVAAEAARLRGNP